MENDLWIKMTAKVCGHKVKTDSPFAMIYYCEECTENNKFTKYGFELCKMSGECDFCDKEVEQKNYFWFRTSYETIEGNYYCRDCARKEIYDVENFDEKLFIEAMNKNIGDFLNGI